jgi:tetratricopeptide (TPR) repeat protein
LLCALLAAGPALASSNRACAQAPTPTSNAVPAGSAAPPGAVPSVEERYAALIRTALAEMDARNYAEARVLFAKAHALQPSARTERGLGTVEFELRRYTVAAVHFRAALASAVRPLDDAMRREVEQALARAISYTGTLQLALEPAQGALKLDGVRIAIPTGALQLDLGVHELSYELAGHHPAHERFEVRGGEQSTLRIALVPQGQSAPSEALAGDEEARDGSGGLLSRWWFWTAAGVVVAGTAIGVAVAASGDAETQAPLPGNLDKTQSVLRVAR